MSKCEHKTVEEWGRCGKCPSGSWNHENDCMLKTGAQPSPLSLREAAERLIKTFESHADANDPSAWAYQDNRLAFVALRDALAAERAGDGIPVIGDARLCCDTLVGTVHLNDCSMVNPPIGAWSFGFKVATQRPKPSVLTEQQRRLGIRHPRYVTGNHDTDWD